MSFRISCKNSKRVNLFLTLFWTSIALCSFFVAMAHKERVDNFKKNSLERGMYMKDREWLIEQIERTGIEIDISESPVNKSLETLDEEGKSE